MTSDASAPEGRIARPVVVVGAGPVGMTAAAALAHAGVPVVVVELNPEPRPDWRASTFHAATLELLDTIDITEHRLEADGCLPRLPAWL